MFLNGLFDHLGIGSSVSKVVFHVDEDPPKHGFLRIDLVALNLSIVLHSAGHQGTPYWETETARLSNRFEKQGWDKRELDEFRAYVEAIYVIVYTRGSLEDLVSLMPESSKRRRQSHYSTDLLIESPCGPRSAWRRKTSTRDNVLHLQRR